MPGLVPGLFLIEESMENQTTVVENPYGLTALWAQGDFVSKGTLIILAVMSLFSWYIILTKIWDQAKLKNSAKTVEKTFWNAPSVKDGIERLKKGDDFRNVAEDGIRAASHHDGRLTDRIDLHEWITLSLQRSVDVVNSKLSTGMAFLATVGSTAPFVGLFGTVWGIYHALIAIGLAGQASIDTVLGYNWLIRRNKSVQDYLRNFAADLHAYLISGARVGATEPGATASGGARPVAAPTAAVRK
jgi:biopolymer transport protein ExbB